MDEHDNSFSTPLLHRARWLVTLDGNTGLPTVIGDGGLLVGGGRILAMGPYAELAREHGGVDVIDHGQDILTPPLVNAHAHLELALFAGIGQKSLAPETSFPDWIRSLIARRRAKQEEYGDTLAQEMIRAGRKALSAMRESGICLVADTGNLIESAAISRESDVDVLFLLELIGISKDGEEAALARLGGNTVELRNELLPAVPAELAVTAHAPYSTGPRLLQEIKRRANWNNTKISIHVAESPAEVEFLKNGTGPFRDFLDEHGGSGGSFSVPGVEPVVYLDRLGLLDASTMCVHGVQLTDSEIKLLARRGAHLCLCPGSNRTLAVGSAPVAKILAAGIRPALGTDSPASNSLINIWEEMRLLGSDHPDIAPAEIFAMATINGARALGRDLDRGALLPGRVARFLRVECPEMKSGGEVCDYLTTTGAAIQCHWATGSTKDDDD